MAKQYYGYLSPVIGKLGPSVGFIWKGRAVMRAYVSNIRYPNTVLQQAERDWFISMVRFAATARSALLLGMRQLAYSEQMTESNVFVKHNKYCFDREGGGCNYGRLQLSFGCVAPVMALTTTVDEGVLRCTFRRHSGTAMCHGSDKVYIYVYDSRSGCGLLSQAVRRGDGMVAMRLPDGWVAETLHAWLFAVDSRGEASASTYVAPTTTATADPQVDETSSAATPQADVAERQAIATGATHATSKKAPPHRCTAPPDE